MPKTLSRAFSILLVSSLAAALTGCMSPMNDRSYVGVDPQAAEPREDLPYETSHGLDRSQWTATTIHVPVDGTAHRPTYNSNIRHTQVSARQRGEYPTAETSLQLGEDSLGDQVVEVPVQIGSAAADAVSIPVGLVVYHQAKTRWSPDVSYERTPSTPPASPSLQPVPAEPVTPTASPSPQPTVSQSPSAPVPSRPIGRMTPVSPSSSEAPR